MNFTEIAHESPIHAPPCDAETRTAKLRNYLLGFGASSSPPLLGRHVEIFLDRSDILDFHDWKVRCHRALRASSFFIVLLSPAYLRSDACRWGLEEWLKLTRRIEPQMNADRRR